jgi:hypothetical protein
MTVKQKKTKIVRSIENDTQELAYNIIKKSITNYDANLLIAPLSNVYYIETDDLFIKILDTQIYPSFWLSFFVSSAITTVLLLRKSFWILTINALFIF